MVIGATLLLLHGLAAAAPPTAEAPTAEAPTAAPEAAPPPPAAPPPVGMVHHVPPFDAEAGQPLELVVRTTDLPAASRLELWVRPLGASGWTTLGFTRRGGDYVATVPAEMVTAPGVEYALLDRGTAPPTPQFASVDDPHEVRVEGDSAAAVMARRLAAHYGQRSRFEGWGDAQSFGRAPGRGPDACGGFGVAYTYRALGPLYLLRFGFSRMRGETPGWDRADGTRPAGLDRGFGKAEFAASDTVGLRVGAEIGADLQQFRAGGEAALRLGRDTGTHLWAWASGTGAVGGSFGASLTWDTLRWDRVTGTPGRPVPMTAAVDVTNWPANGRYAVRLRTGVDLPVGEHLGLQLQASYQARTALAGGPGGLLGASWSF